MAVIVVATVLLLGLLEAALRGLAAGVCAGRMKFRTGYALFLVAVPVAWGLAFLVSMVIEAFSSES